MPINGIASEGKEALAVIEAWGFIYKTIALCWVKQNRRSKGLFMGVGNQTHRNAESCLLATKGDLKRRENAVRSTVPLPIEWYSKKPDEVRKRIVELMGDLPRIELFARQTAHGWDTWGNEVSEDVYRERPLEPPEPKPVMLCERCSCELYEGDPYYDCDGADLCQECA